MNDKRFLSETETLITSQITCAHISTDEKKKGKTTELSTFHGGEEQI